MCNQNNTEQDVQIKFSGIDNRFLIINKRINNLIITVLIIGLFFLVLIAASYYNIAQNFSNEKADLREFMRELKENFGKLEPSPNIELVGLNGLPLQGQKLPVKLVQKNGNKQLEISYIAKNTGKKATGQSYLKYYANDPIILSNPSIDEPNFKFETYVNPKDINPSEIPGGNYSVHWTSKINLMPSDKEISGEHQFLLKYYYGESKVSSAKFTILINNN